MRPAQSIAKNAIALNIQVLGLAGALVALLVLATACGVSKIRGSVVSCADQKPIPNAKITMVEANQDPNKTNVTGNYYYGATKEDGTFEMKGWGDADKTYWTAKAEKEGYQEGAARFEPGTPPQPICLQPLSSGSTPPPVSPAK